ncbi:MAG: UDP-3-O-(3-hydroxymyristoyl)glucosamine N-acyltransferase [Endomicrobium sp.]|jgi:UDP-3-O-[3-hydroxymyristoyl] glucosamine N-acyltransferase|nr:UDP-3-O-(3-hydroxymyristoyl)glucosamine N-acyltransferase [Endomicrobium sp.]
MKITALELVKIVSGEVIGNVEEIITGVNGLEQAKNGDLSFLGNPKYVTEALKTKASVILIPQNTDISAFKNKTLIKTQNPQYAFSKVLAIIDKERIDAIGSRIHSSASISEKAFVGNTVYIGQNVVIEDGVEIGGWTKIFPNVYIGKNSKIGESCIFYPNVVIRENTIIGNRVILQPGVIIGGDGFGFATVDGINHKIAQIGNVEIGSDVEIGAGSAVDRAAVGTTKIGRGTKIDNFVQIAHNVQIGENCIIVAQSGIAGSTKIGNNVTIGAQVGISGHIKIGNNVIISSQSGVGGNLLDGDKVGGNPLAELGESIKIRATMRKLPKMYKDIKSIKKQLEMKK